MNTTLANLSPIAAKLYLALHTYPGADANPPTPQASLPSLAAHTNLSERSCSYALRELLDRKLITRLPKKPHEPSRYQLHPLPDPHATATLPPSDPQPAATLPLPDSHPVATLPPKNPIPTSKPHHSHPAATHLTFTPAEEALLSNPTFLKLLMSTLSPAENATLLQSAQSTLAHLDAQEAHQ